MIASASQRPFIRVLTGKPYKKDADIHADILGKVRIFSLLTQIFILLNAQRAIAVNGNGDNEISGGGEVEEVGK